VTSKGSFLLAFSKPLKEKELEMIIAEVDFALELISADEKPS